VDLVRSADHRYMCCIYIPQTSVAWFYEILLDSPRMKAPISTDQYQQSRVRCFPRDEPSVAASFSALPFTLDATNNTNAATINNDPRTTCIQIYLPPLLPMIAPATGGPARLATPQIANTMPIHVPILLRSPLSSLMSVLVAPGKIP